MKIPEKSVIIITESERGKTNKPPPKIKQFQFGSRPTREGEKHDKERIFKRNRKFNKRRI